MSFTKNSELKFKIFYDNEIYRFKIENRVTLEKLKESILKLLEKTNMEQNLLLFSDKTEINTDSQLTQIKSLKK